MKPRVLVVGAGWFARFHVAGWQAIGAEVAAVCDTDGNRARSVEGALGVPGSSEAAQLLMERLHPDVVDVVLPPAAQAPVVEHALALRLLTICQKPFGINLRQAQQLAHTAAEAATPLVVHENFRFAPWFREARRMVDAGQLGRLHSISFRLRPGDGQGAQAYLDRQPYFQTMPRLLVRETAVHFIDSFRYLLGEVRAVTARLRRLNPAIAGEDAGIVILEFDDERTGLFDGNRLNDHSASDARRTMGEMWLEGSAGVLRLDGEGRLWWKPQHGTESQHPCPLGEGPFGGAVAALQAHVLAHLQVGSPLENTAELYLPNLLVQEAVYESHRQGRRIEMAHFDPHETHNRPPGD